MSENYWNYRVMRKTLRSGVCGREHHHYGIYEVYYRCGKPTNWSQNASAVFYENLEDIVPTLNKMLRGATELPILSHETGEEIDA